MKAAYYVEVSELSLTSLCLLVMEFQSIHQSLALEGCFEWLGPGVLSFQNYYLFDSTHT